MVMFFFHDHKALKPHNKGSFYVTSALQCWIVGFVSNVVKHYGRILGFKHRKSQVKQVNL